jgi:hypothetical protein
MVAPHNKKVVGLARVVCCEWATPHAQDPSLTWPPELHLGKHRLVYQDDANGAEKVKHQGCGLPAQQLHGDGAGQGTGGGRQTVGRLLGRSTVR